MIKYEYHSEWYNMDEIQHIQINDNNFIDLYVEYNIPERGSNQCGFTPNFPATINQIYLAAVAYNPGLYIIKFYLKFATKEGLVGIYSRNIDDLRYTDNDGIIQTIKIDYREVEEWIPVKENGPYPDDWAIVQIMETDSGFLALPKIGEYRQGKDKWCIEGSFESTNGWLEGDFEKDFKVIAWRRLPYKYIPPVIALKEKG